MSAPALTELQSITGSFTPEAFAAHLAPQASAPAWWLERKRTAYDKFATLLMPKRKDESWRFSNISTLTLEGFKVGQLFPVATPPLQPFGTSAMVFVNNEITSR